MISTAGVSAVDHRILRLRVGGCPQFPPIRSLLGIDFVSILFVLRELQQPLRAFQGV